MPMHNMVNSGGAVNVGIHKQNGGARVRINTDACNACGICGDVCPRHIPETIEQDKQQITVVSQDRHHLCMQCGHCVAVCPNNAVSAEGLKTEEFAPLTPLDMDDDQLMAFLRQRRSVRRYKDRPVPREIIDRIVSAAGSAPTGTGRSTTGIIVMDKPETLVVFSELVYDMYENLEKNLRNPVARFFVKKKAGEKNYRMLQDFVMPGMHWYIRWYRDGKSNEVLRDCPAVMLFHSPMYEPVAAENCLIAAFQAIMMSKAMGIGSCFNDLIPPACNRVPEIRELLDLPDEREVYAGITMGYPKYVFKRIPPRKPAHVRYIE